ncbi:MAG: TIGR00282 family metallophosphoesterase [Amylibacter sp.]|jgi:metallophosphoesterase (TIGR00282 family)|tara:strand:- start:3267 stop:4082 length:816 start_codon:yes stop_codon:yes gene_type:complete
MRLLFLGDIMGRSGRKAISERLKSLREKWRLDFVVVNGENATGGMGLSGSHAKVLIDSGVDCITLGDHAFDQRDMLTFCEQEPRIIRPLNFAKTAPGKGSRLIKAQNGKKVLVAQALGQVFMKKPYDDPFSALDTALKAAPLGGMADAVIVDFHAEATSEKVAIGHWLDGRASLVIGTHTHIPTADTQILPKGTAHQSDAGMCGDYNSVIGMQKDEPLRRFITGMNKDRFTPAADEATLCGIYVETDDKTGLAKNVVQIRIGGRLQQSEPS